jgi:hypothetical protein
MLPRGGFDPLPEGGLTGQQVDHAPQALERFQVGADRQAPIVPEGWLCDAAEACGRAKALRWRPSRGPQLSAGGGKIGAAPWGAATWGWP